MIDIFISHSSADVRVADALIQLIRLAIPKLDANRLRCTSVEGYRLPGGAKTEDHLRKEMLEAQVFVGVLTHESLQSTYVLFELGARWGAGMQFTPLLAAGTTPKDLRAPLQNVNALSCNSEAQLHQLIDEIATTLNLTKSSPALYTNQLREVLSISALEAERRQNLPRTLRFYNRAFDVYTAIPSVIANIDKTAAGSKQLMIAILHGSTGAAPRNWNTQLSEQEGTRFQAFDAAILECIRSSGAGSWHVKEFKNIARVDRLKRTLERLSEAKDGYEVRAVCIPEMVPCLSPLVIGDEDVLFAIMDTGTRRVGAALHIHSREAVEFAKQYFSLIWDKEAAFRLRTNEGINNEAVSQLREKIRTNQTSSGGRLK